MTDQVNILIWFYDDLGKVKSLKLGKFLNAENKRKKKEQHQERLNSIK